MPDHAETEELGVRLSPNSHWRRYPEVYVHGKRIVHPGETVQILPVELRPHRTAEERRRSQEQYDALLDALGSGPLTIKWICLWDCGKAQLYFDKRPGYVSDCNEVFSHVKNFM